MLKISLLLSFCFPLLLQAQGNRKITIDLQKGKLKEDTSFAYWLPYEEGKSYIMVQRGYTKHSHRHLAANDFKMRKGSTICAARAGIVTDVKESSNRGGLNDKYLEDWNYIVIEHEDGSSALYGHLQQNGAHIAVGDTIKQGQAIALSGNTGYSAFPHLHFQVWNKDGAQIQVRFLTAKGVVYLRQLKTYRRPSGNSDKLSKAPK